MVGDFHEKNGLKKPSRLRSTVFSLKKVIMGVTLFNRHVFPPLFKYLFDSDRLDGLLCPRIGEFVVF
jgi:hypothetical protein